MFRRSPDPAPAEDVTDMLRIRMLKRLSDYLDQGITQVSVRVMLDLLDPNYVMPPAPDKPDARADPLTGAMPVLPEAYR